MSGEFEAAQLHVENHELRSHRNLEERLMAVEMRHMELAEQLATVTAEIAELRARAESGAAAAADAGEDAGEKTEDDVEEVVEEPDIRETPPAPNHPLFRRTRRD